MSDAADYVQGERLSDDDIARALRDGVLLGQECADCGHGTGTAAAACSHCGSRDTTAVVLPEDGEIYTETRINVPPPAFEGPYTVAIVELSDGTRLTAHIESDVSVGDAVSFQGTIAEDIRPAPVFG
ncbi:MULTISPECIES: Zn-ribbon domain-containing OB-fold protein [Salinibaculum]|uniref:Zn-ribbon domain-containing OB-fold protein n=1 Tax=Salinibaculum TaxID=2732368 RepID=UPI0030D3994E